jgi:hypothetical protein
MEDEQVKNGFLLVVCSAFPILFMACGVKPLSNHKLFIPDRFVVWQTLLHSNYAALVMQFNSTSSSTAMQQGPQGQFQ